MADDTAAEVTSEAGSAAEVEAVLREFAGDHRAAIAALLHDLDLLARDAAAATSRGYVRGRFFKLRPLKEAGR